MKTKRLNNATLSSFPTPCPYDGRGHLPTLLILVACPQSDALIESVLK